MKFMLIVIPKDYGKAAPDAMPSPHLAPHLLDCPLRAPPAQT